MSGFAGEYVAHVKSELERGAGTSREASPKDDAHFPKGRRTPRGERAYRKDMTRWEYMTLDCASVEDLNGHGADGWELVGYLPILAAEDGDGEEITERMLVLKRPAPEKRP